MATKKATKKCANHCSACGSHFTSLRAFDAHRSGPWDGERVCWGGGSDQEADLRPATEDGVCEMYAERRVGVTIYELGAHADRARTQFR